MSEINVVTSSKGPLPETQPVGRLGTLHQRPLLVPQVPKVVRHVRRVDLRTASPSKGWSLTRTFRLDSDLMVCPWPSALCHSSGDGIVVWPPCDGGAAFAGSFLLAGNSLNEAAGSVREEERRKGEDGGSPEGYGWSWWKLGVEGLEWRLPVTGEKSGARPVGLVVVWGGGAHGRTRPLQLIESWSNWKEKQ